MDTEMIAITLRCFERRIRNLSSWELGSGQHILETSQSLKSDNLYVYLSESFLALPLDRAWCNQLQDLTTGTGVLLLMLIIICSVRLTIAHSARQPVTPIKTTPSKAFLPYYIHLGIQCSQLNKGFLCLWSYKGIPNFKDPSLERPTQPSWMAVWFVPVHSLPRYFNINLVNDVAFI